MFYGRVIAMTIFGIFHFLLFVSGCGGVLCASKLNAAGDSFDKVQTLQGELIAPYEYTLAQLHLIQARREMALANYSDAITLAEQSDEASKRALQLIEKAKSK